MQLIRVGNLDEADWLCVSAVRKVKLCRLPTCGGNVEPHVTILEQRALLTCIAKGTFGLRNQLRLVVEVSKDCPLCKSTFTTGFATLPAGWFQLIAF